MVRRVHPRIAERRRAILETKAAALKKEAILRRKKATDVLIDIERRMTMLSMSVDDPTLNQLRHEAVIEQALLKQFDPDDENWREIEVHVREFLNRVDVHMKSLENRYLRSRVVQKRNLHAIFNPADARVISFFQHEDGTIGFEPLVLLHEEGVWVPDGWHTDCRAANLEEAISEAMERVPWLRDEVS